MSQPSRHSIDELSPQQVADDMRAGRILLIDVREPHDYAMQRIAGALLYPLSTFDAAILPPDQPRQVVFLCGSGKRSTMAANARMQAGATSAAHVTGGMAAWLACGLSVIHIDPATGGQVK